MADAGRSQIERGRGAEPARADDRHAGLLQLALSFDADLRQAQLARIAIQEIGIQRRRAHRQAVALPSFRAAFDAGDMLEALLQHRFGDIERTQAALADQQDLGLTRQVPGSVRQQVVLRKSFRALRHPAGLFGLAAHIDQSRAGLLTRRRLSRAQAADASHLIPCA